MDDTRWLKIIAISASLVGLVSKVLSARKSARDWKQAEYCRALCSTVTAASTVLKVPTWDKANSRSGTGEERSSVMQHPGALGRTNRAELLHLTAAAQSELCQLLPAALQQQQQQGQPAAQSSAQPQQQQGQAAAQQQQQPSKASGKLPRTYWHGG